ncbi:MAG: MarR family winged helix-turn-helix transcriptional regulator [Candidatus Tectimicrobiota bacterium]
MTYYEGTFPGFDPADALVVISLIRTEDVYARAREAYLARYGLTGSTLNVLMFLDSTPEDRLPMHAISENLLVSRANITGLIDSLEKRGYVRRRPDEADRRVVHAEITEEGRAVLHALLPGHFRAVEAMLESFSPEEKASLVEFLARVRAGVADGYTEAASDDEE